METCGYKGLRMTPIFFTPAVLAIIIIHTVRCFLTNMKIQTHNNYSCLVNDKLMLTCSLMQLYVYGQTDLINNNVNKIALSDIEELIKFIPKFNTEYIRVYWEK